LADLGTVDRRRIEPDLVSGQFVDRAAGSSAQEKADALRATSPVRSVLARVLGAHTDERAWRLGSQGEKAVAARLAKLSTTWYVYHDISIGTSGANIDHLVVGPNGVFSLNTKNLSGRVWVGERVLMVNGHRTDYLPKAAREAARVARCLRVAHGRPVPVRAVIVLICPKLTVKSVPVDVDVVAHRRIRAWLEAQATSLSATEVSAIADAARRPIWSL
jgi:hypothetical protein